MLAGADGVALAVSASRALFDRAPLVVVTADADASRQAEAATVAVALRVPLLLAPGRPGTSGPGTPTDDATPDGATTQELRRLGPTAVLAVGAPAAAWARQRLPGVTVVLAPNHPADLARVAGIRLAPAVGVRPADLVRSVAALPLDRAPALLRTSAVAAQPAVDFGAGSQPPLPRIARPTGIDGVVVLSSTASQSLAAAASARAAGAQVLVTDQPDPRASARVIATLSEQRPRSVLGLGGTFGSKDVFSRRVAVASSGRTLPGGGQLVLPGRLYVALYGHPGSDALGVLGEQNVKRSVARAKTVAASYERAGSPVPVIPTFEIITTVASAGRGSDGDYSAESSIEHVLPWVEAAGRAGIYVVLDLQSGRADFLRQAKRYERLLALPHVGLALDPEWRLKPGQTHLRQIGSVSAKEVNSVIDWLAAMTRARRLPQKMLVLHQFRLSMLANRERLDTTQDEVAVVVQMDGHGPPNVKMSTWRAITSPSPAGLRFGWKNFYDEDSPTATPAKTLAIRPMPVFVSYQ